MYPRGCASEVLHAVADACFHGAYADEIDPFELGRAIARTLVNRTGGDFPKDVERLIAGMRHDRDSDGTPQY